MRRCSRWNAGLHLSMLHCYDSVLICCYFCSHVYELHAAVFSAISWWEWCPDMEIVLSWNFLRQKGELEYVLVFWFSVHAYYRLKQKISFLSSSPFRAWVLCRLIWTANLVTPPPSLLVHSSWQRSQTCLVFQLRRQSLVIPIRYLLGSVSSIETWGRFMTSVDLNAQAARVMG